MNPAAAVLAERGRAGGEARSARTMLRLRRMAALPAGVERELMRERLIADHMGDARRMAARYLRRGVPQEDLEQVAYLGLVKAVDNFEPGYGVAFLGYATPVIVGELKRYFRDSTWHVHVPRRMQELTLAVHRATEALGGELGREATVQELARWVGADEEEVVEAFDASSAYRVSSLDRPVGLEPDGMTVGDLLGQDDPGYDRMIDHEILKVLVRGLAEQDKRILLLRFFRGLTQLEIGAELGVTQMQVSRTIARILAQLRDGFGEH